jgi:hypothetical protein
MFESGDRTGPAGLGPRQAGLPAWGGYVNLYVPSPAAVAPTVPPEQELDGLKQQAEYLQNALSEINKRIKQLETKSKK